MKSIVTKYEDICAISGRRATEEHHLIFGRGFKELADEDGLVIPVHREFHTGKHGIHGSVAAEHLSKMCGQLAWEKHEIAEKGVSEDEARERFRARYGRSYL